MSTNLKLMAALILGSSLAACGGSSSGGGGNDNDNGGGSSSSSSSSGVDCSDPDNILHPTCVEDPQETEIDITSQDMPVAERFEVEGDGNQIETFFSPEYRSLRTAEENDDYEDEHPSLFYPTCCLWEVDEETGDRTGELIPDIDTRQYVGLDDDGVGYFAFSNARWSLGQLYPDIVSDADSEDGDAKTGTTNAPVGSSWGELDLSEEYRVSFCLKDTGLAGAGTGGNLEVYVDNNSGGNQGHSIHGNQSLLLRTTAASLEPGNRVVIDVPGDVRLQDDNGDQVGEIIDNTAEVFGTENSFLQFRVSSGGYAVISDLMIEHQSDLEDNYMPCEADSSLFEPPLPEGYAFPGLPLDEDFEDITVEELTGDGDDIAGEFMAVSSDLTIPFYKFNSSERLAIDDGTLHISNNRFTMGFVGPDNTSAEDEEVAGDIDLSEPFTLTLEIAERPDSDEGRLQVLLDNSTTSSGNSVHGEASALLATTWGQLGTGTLEIQVPGDVLLDGQPVMNEEGDPITIDEHFGTETSFFQIWCPSDCGDDIEGEGFGVKFDSILLDNQEDSGDSGEVWTPEDLVVAGGTTDAEGSVGEESEDSITITATGGNVDSSNHNIFYAYQQEDISDFVFSGRIASVEGADAAAGNGKRFGLMVMSDISNIGGSYEDMHPWADIGFYADDEKDGDPLDAVELIGSRGNMKPDGSRTRSDILDLEEGDYVRIEVYDDGENKRVRRCFSQDDGATWTSANSTTDFAATSETDSWYYGIYAAPGENEVTMTVDNIVFEEYESDCDS